MKKSSETGPVYGVQLLESVPIGLTSFYQRCPNRKELEEVKKISEPTVAAFEVLTGHYYRHLHEIAATPPWLPDLIKALGWQSGTIHQCIEKVREIAGTGGGK